MNKRGRPKPHVPRLPNVIANSLRDRILSGDIQDGAFLPKQEELIEEFNVSPPSIREALRILETEGLVTVLRGRGGGSVVHVPNEQKAAYTIASVLQAKQVGLSDVAAAIQIMEPLCCELAAMRKDRKRTIVPKLREYLKRKSDSVDDAEEYRACSARFHRELVCSSGNETLILFAGALESLWASHAQSRANMDQWPIPVTTKKRKLYAKNSEDIVNAIEQGNPALARELAANHLKAATRHTLAGDDVGVNASWLMGH